MSNPKDSKHLERQKMTKKFDCSECSYCCEFVIIKVKKSIKAKKAKQICKPTATGGKLIMGERRFFDGVFFRYHNIKVIASRDAMLYQIPKGYGVFWKETPDELWFRVNARCKRLNKKSRLCKIYDRRPEVCKDSGCIKLESGFEGIYEKGWAAL